MTISIELDHDLYPDVSGRVSHETIYTGVYAHGTAGLAKGLHTRLHRHRRCRKHRRAPGVEPVTRGPLGECTPIGLRPAEAETRTRIGDFEGDLICGSFNRSAIVTMFDRCSRKVWLASLPEGHGAEPTLAALLELFERIEERFHRTLTWDRGSEMAHHDLLAEETGLDIYFAEPHSPWQRGTNENGNGLLRRYLPKGTNLGVYTETDLRAIETRLNTMPRRSLGWQTAQHVYDHHPLR